MAVWPKLATWSKHVEESGEEALPPVRKAWANSCSLVVKMVRFRYKSLHYDVPWHSSYLHFIY